MKKIIFLFAALYTFTISAHAAFPEKDITLIVPWSAGGGTDTIARALALPRVELPRPERSEEGSKFRVSPSLNEPLVSWKRNCAALSMCE